MNPAKPTDAVEVLQPMSTEQAQAYQRLRGHLSKLRLTAAAESLTTVLDAARDEDLSAVTVLERLLGTEVAAVKARRHAGLPAGALPDRGFRLQRAARGGRETHP
jgi:hypothetical protein